MRLVAEASGGRLDLFVAEHAQMTRSAAQKLIEDGHVLVSGVMRPKIISSARARKCASTCRNRNDLRLHRKTSPLIFCMRMRILSW